LLVGDYGALGFFELKGFFKQCHYSFSVCL
jgi:hypothetical protein